MPTWLVSAGRWVWKYGKWIVFPLGLVAWLLGRRRPVNVVSSEMEGQVRVELEAERMATAAREKAWEKRDGKITKVEREIDSKLDKLKRDARKTAERLQDDPDATNEFLKNVGKGVRRG